MYLHRRACCFLENIVHTHTGFVQNQTKKYKTLVSAPPFVPKFVTLCTVRSAVCRFIAHNPLPVIPHGQRNTAYFFCFVARLASGSKLGVNPPVIFLGGRRGSIF